MPAPDFTTLAKEQVERLRAVKAKRDAKAVARSLDALKSLAAAYVGDSAVARPTIMPSIVDAVRVRATVGEISDALESQWGRYRPR